jgi:hypothetical protein
MNDRGGAATDHSDRTEIFDVEELAQLGDHAAVIERTKSLRAGGSQPACLLILAAKANLALKKFPEAFADAVDAVRANENCVDSTMDETLLCVASEYIEHLLQLGQPEGIIDCLNRLPDRLGSRWEVLLARILSSLWYGDLAKAKADLRKLPLRSISSPMALHRAAAFAAVLKEGTMATAFYTELLRDNLDRFDLLEESCNLRAAIDPQTRCYNIGRPVYGLSIAAAIKNEGDSILEWIAYHRILGVEHFYLYLNDCNDNTEAEIKRFSEQERLTIHYVPGELGQARAYGHFIYHYKYASEWCAFIDADEYLVPLRHGDLRDFVSDKLFERASGIAVHWLNFGSNGHEVKPSVPTIAAFTSRARSEFPDHFVMKGINRMQQVITYLHPHQNKLYGCYMQEDGVAVFPVSGRLATAKHEVVRLHHYYTKSRQQMLAKRARGRPLRADDPARTRDLSFFAMRDTNEVHDGAAARFLPSLNEFLARCNQIPF